MSLGEITGVVLAGGLGRRMGGTDKGLQLLDGRALVQRVLERLEPQVDAVVINANQNLDRYRAFGHPVISDLFGGFAGPLAGLHAALTAAETELVVSAPCDSPFLPLDLVARLHQGLQDSRADLAVARTRENTHRAFCLTRRAVLPKLEAFLATGEHKVGLWHSTLKLCAVDFDDQAAAFANINTSEELAAASTRTSP